MEVAVCVNFHLIFLYACSFFLPSPHERISPYTLNMKYIFTVFFLLICSCLFAQTWVVKPFIQDASPQSIYVSWETSSDTQSDVNWGTTPALGNSSTGTAVSGSGGSQVHHTQITGLQPDTRYYYQVKTGGC